ncbi:hypothetical protein N9741_00455 [Octadecabacter sp.]|nr:hypothetical protein [Octadecabacter sp.]
MPPIALYPSLDNIKKSGIFSAIILFASLNIWSGSGFNILSISMLLTGVSAVFLYNAVDAYRNPKPSFEADFDGFSFLGKPKMGWD